MRYFLIFNDKLFLPIPSVPSPEKLDFVAKFYLLTSMTYCVVIYSCSTCSSIQMNNDNDLCILRFKTFHLQSYVTCYAFDYLLKLEQILLCQHNQFLLEFFWVVVIAKQQVEELVQIASKEAVHSCINVFA